MGLKIVVTSGGTSEYIDKVRKITNSGTGKLGSLIANEFAMRKDVEKIFYIHTPKAVLPTANRKYFEFIEVIDTNSVKDAVEKVLSENRIDIFIHTMAISDYYVDYVSTIQMIADEAWERNYSDIENVLKNPYHTLDNSSKLSSSEDNLVVVLKQTPKIIGMIKELSPETKLVGFKLLENVTKEHLLGVARKLMEKNNCDFVVANDLKDIKNGNHKAFLISKDGKEIEMNGKEEIARILARDIIL